MHKRTLTILCIAVRLVVYFIIMITTYHYRIDLTNQCELKKLIYFPRRHQFLLIKNSLLASRIVISRWCVNFIIRQ